MNKITSKKYNIAKNTFVGVEILLDAYIIDCKYIHSMKQCILLVNTKITKRLGGWKRTRVNNMQELARIRRKKILLKRALLISMWFTLLILVISLFIYYYYLLNKYNNKPLEEIPEIIMWLMNWKRG